MILLAEDEKPVDLHNKEFCVDVSNYGPLEWIEKEGEECKTEFVKKCDAVAKEISKKKSIDTRVNVAKTKVEKLAELFSDDWESIGLDFRVSFGYAEEKNLQIGQIVSFEYTPEQ